MTRSSSRPFRFSLRVKLLLLSVAVLSLPFVGLEYLREMERYLRETLESSLTESAQAIAGSLHERPDLMPESSATVPALYIHRLRQPVQLDGYSEDWQDFLEWSERYSTAGGSSLSYRLILARDDYSLYALLRVDDDRVVYQRPGSGDNRDGDHIQLTVMHRDGTLQQLYFAPLGPGSLRPFEVYTERDDYDFAFERQRYVTHIAAEWQPHEHGYTLEMRLPRGFYQHLGFTVHDMDDGSTRTLAHSVGTAGGRTVQQPNPLLTSSPAIEQLVDYQSREAGRRVWVLNDHGQVLASSGDLRRDLDHSGGRFFYNLILPPPARYFTDDLAGASRLQGNEVQAALAGKVETRWRGSPDGRAVIASAAAPVRVDNGVRGAVVVEESTHQIQMLKRAALANLVNKTLLTYGVVTLLLLVFATRLSLRLRQLSRAAEAAIDEHGRVIGTLQPSSVSDEIGDLSRGYAAMLERLRHYNDYLENLAGRLTHELRTPLTVVQSSLDNLDGSSAQEREVFVERAREGLRRLNMLVTRLSEAARLEQALQVADRKNLDLGRLVGECVEGYRVAYPQREFVFHAPAHAVTVHVAPDLIAQLLDKLISNADDFAIPGSPITLVLNETQHAVELTVDNSGPLLPEELREQMFDSMVSQRSGEHKQEPHLGMGLYLARLIADFHRGRLQAGNLGDGSGVRMTLILPKPQA